ncbi:MAG: RAMP superfamily CRISPR-associated protein, partial [Planctomycetia bacterium]
LLTEIPARRFQSNSLIGGFQARQYRYDPDPDHDVRKEHDLRDRRAQQRMFPYNPTLVVDAGSVFVLKVAEEQQQQAAQRVAEWLAHGLPLPQWACRAYGDTHHTNIFLPQNGYGEIEVAGAIFDAVRPAPSLLHCPPTPITLPQSSPAVQPSAAAPCRSILQVRLTTTSPLAIHTGLSTHDQKALGILDTTHWFRAKSDTHAGVRDCDALVARDHRHQPYIPGSALKGVIREWLTRPGFYEQHREVIDWMLGTAAVSADEETSEEQGRGGGVVFEDAFPDAQQEVEKLPECRHPFYEASRWTFVDQHTSVNRRTGAVKQGALYSAEAVREDIAFQTQVILDHGLDAEKHALAVHILKNAFAAFAGALHTVPPQTGSETRNGWGRLKCEITSHQHWTPAGRISPPTEANRGLSVGPSGFRRRRLVIRINLRFCGPFTTMDPARTVIGDKSHREKSHKEKNQNTASPLPDSSPRIKSLETPRETPPAGAWPQRATPLLPAASFKGVFRSHMEAILRTIHPGIAVSPHGQLQPVTAQSPEFVWRLLGMESHQSALWCSDFVGTESQDLFLREMVAIDRFTGGAAESKKYNALVFQAPTLTGSLAVDLPDDNATACRILGALALTLRDLLEGHLTFGYGETKGFGQCTAQIVSLHHAGIDLATLTGCPNSPTPAELDRWLFCVVQLLRNQEPDLRVNLANQYLNIFLDAVRADIVEAVSR